MMLPKDMQCYINQVCVHQNCTPDHWTSKVVLNVFEEKLF